MFWYRVKFRHHYFTLFFVPKSWNCKHGKKSIADFGNTAEKVVWKAYMLKSQKYWVNYNKCFILGGNFHGRIITKVQKHKLNGLLQTEEIHVHSKLNTACIQEATLMLASYRCPNSLHPRIPLPDFKVHRPTLPGFVFV